VSAQIYPTSAKYVFDVTKIIPPAHQTKFELRVGDGINGYWEETCDLMPQHNKAGDVIAFVQYNFKRTWVYGSRAGL
jgi:hypothetical protein